MANCCIADVALYRDTRAFTKKDTAQIQAALADIAHCGGDIAYRDDQVIEWQGDTRWALPQTELAAIAKRFGARIRAIGRDDSMGFIEVMKFAPNGDLISHEGLDT